jgi:hypothetical protein
MRLAARSSLLITQHGQLQLAVSISPFPRFHICH